MIVVDLGCHPHGEERSTEYLLDRFQPDIYYGFDPLAKEGSERQPRSSLAGDTLLVWVKSAAWVEAGNLEIDVRGMATYILPDGARMAARARRVRCFNFPEWVQTLPPPVVVKMDVEGAEYPILTRMIENGTLCDLNHLLVEFHTPPWDHGRLIDGLPERITELCPTTILEPWQ